MIHHHYPSIQQVLDGSRHQETSFFEETFTDSLNLKDIYRLLGTVDYESENDMAINHASYGRISPLAVVYSDQYKYEIITRPTPHPQHDEVVNSNDKKKRSKPSSQTKCRAMPILTETNSDNTVTRYFWQGNGYYLSEDGLQIEYQKGKFKDRLKRFIRKKTTKPSVTRELLQDIRNLKRIEMARYKYFCRQSN